MSNVIEQKKQVVDEIAEKLQASNSIVVVDYRGLNVAEVTELRKQLREAGIEFKVYKNTLTRRAVEKLELTDLNDALVGPNAIAFGGVDTGKNKAQEALKPITNGKIIGLISLPLTMVSKDTPIGIKMVVAAVLLIKLASTIVIKPNNASKPKKLT